MYKCLHALFIATPPDTAVGDGVAGDTAVIYHQIARAKFGCKTAKN